MTRAHEETQPATPPTPVVDAAEVERRMSFADAALGAAGHEVTDPVLRELNRKVAAGTLSADEAIALGLAHIDR